MKVNGKPENNMEMGLLFYQMDQKKLEFGKMENEYRLLIIRTVHRLAYTGIISPNLTLVDLNLDLLNNNNNFNHKAKHYTNIVRTD